MCGGDDRCLRSLGAVSEEPTDPESLRGRPHVGRRDRQRDRWPVEGRPLRQVDLGTCWLLYALRGSDPRSVGVVMDYQQFVAVVIALLMMSVGLLLLVIMEVRAHYKQREAMTKLLILAL